MCAKCCKKYEGFYCNFIGDVEFHMDQPWYNVRDAMRVLKRIRRLDFADPENRYKALCWLNGMECRVPYGAFCRFPYKSFYITEAGGNWGECLVKLKKMLVAKCMVKFEIGTTPLPSCGRKWKNCIGTSCCDLNAKCCAGESCCYRHLKEPAGPPEPENRCPITSEICDKCMRHEPPSCCPEWSGTCKVEKVPESIYKNYLKGFQEVIQQLIRVLERKDCVFDRKTFENHYKVIWKTCKKKCEILEDTDSGDYLCDDCCREEQAKHCCQTDDNDFSTQ